MPILPPPVNFAPYDQIYKVISTAKTRLNDALPTLYPVGGQILGNSNPETQQMVNAAWRKLQEFLANLGYTRLTDEQTLFQCPPTASTDPSAQTYINWFNFFDGANIYPAPVLPPNLIVPLRLWERQNGNASGFVPMGMMMDGLPTWNKQARNLCWEWRGDAIYMPGSLQTMDLRIRYACYLGDFIDVGDVPWFQQPVPIMRCVDSLAYFICAEVLEAREDQEENPFVQKAESAARLIMNRDISLKQRKNIRRRPRSGRGEGTWGGLWC